jgi:hypothetical protein
MRNFILVFILIGALLIVSCGGGESDPEPSIEILSSTVNGASSSGVNLNIPVDVSIVFVFSSALNPSDFQSAFTVTGGSSPVEFTLAYTNASSKVTATMTLKYNTTYTVNLAAAPIGAKGEKLKSPQNFTFKTAEDNVIRSMTPCTNTGDCLRSVKLTGSQGLGTFEFYSNYPIYEENAAWENLTHAVIVVHGASHDPENYYSWMTNTFQAESISGSTVLISPFFRSTATGSTADFYWANTNWRRGQESSNANKLSSFDAIDALINQLANTTRFPVLEKIIITGHSSGAALTHVYAAANKSEANHPTIEFEYVPANAQFYYYPDGQRIDEATNQLYTPSTCSGYDVWPLGYKVTPPYLTGVSSSTYNTRFLNRKVTYLIGNGSQSDPTLNTTDCQNVLQGTTRYKRGENMFRYMELVYPGTHNHSRTIVNGIGHNGQGMYQSIEFKSLLTALLQ